MPSLPAYKRLDWASSGVTVTVESGTYAESVRLDKKILLVGIDSGNGAPIIDPGKTGNAVEIRSDGCTVEDFVIRNSELLNGVRVSSDLNTIRKNAINNNAQGITLASSQKNTISGNNITNNLRTGIAIENSNGNMIEDNMISANTHGISLDEYSLSNRISGTTFSTPKMCSQRALPRSGAQQPP